MSDLIMTKWMFFKLIVVPFFGGWFMASATVRFMIVGLVRATKKKKKIIFFCMLLSMVACFACFGIINALVVIKLEVLQYITTEQSSSWFLNGLPSALTALFFMERSYRRIMDPRR